MEVKGSAVKFIPQFIIDKFGEEAHSRWIESLSIQAKEVFYYVIVASNWYPLKEILIEPVKTLCNLFYFGSPKGAYESGKYSAKLGLKGIYKAFIHLGSPQMVVKKASAILPTFYRPADIKVIENEKGSAVLNITEFEEMDEVVEYRILGWMEKALEICGCKKINIKATRSLAKGDNHSQIQITYL